MIAHRKLFGVGFGMMVAFLIVLALIFMPLINGQNGLQYLDNLYNSISKGSAYYIPKVKEETDRFAGKTIEVELAFADEAQAKQGSSLFMKSGAMVNLSGKSIKISGDLSQILAGALDDCDKMYYNDDQALQDKYGMEGRQALFVWWTAFGKLEKALQGQKKFKEAKVVALTTQKAIETSYNYFGIAPEKIMDKVWVVIFSLVFYVCYTLWYGFGIMYMFEGWGMQLGH